MDARITLAAAQLLLTHFSEGMNSSYVLGHASAAMQLAVPTWQHAGRAGKDQ